MFDVIEPTTAIPRVVRVSNLHNVKQVKWFFLAALPVLAICASYLVAHTGDPNRSRLWWGVSVIALLYALSFGIMIPGLVTLMSGTFTADERGIEFMPYTPRLRRWRYIEWAEVNRIQWLGMAVRLVADDASLQITWRDLRPGDRELLKGRVEAALSNDFDLAISTAPRPAWRRLALAAGLPVISIGLCSAFSVRHPHFIAAPLILMGAWIALLFALAVRQIVKQNRNPHSPHYWRVRRMPT